MFLNDIVNVDEHIVKHGDGYRLLSHKGKNLGDFPSKSAAMKHEREVQYFKHAHESEELNEFDPRGFNGGSEQSFYKALSSAMEQRGFNCVQYEKDIKAVFRRDDDLVRVEQIFVNKTDDSDSDDWVGVDFGKVVNGRGEWRRGVKSFERSIHVIPAIVSAVEELNESTDYDDDNECWTCRGTGEGQFDGQSCPVCRGTGVAPRHSDDDEDFDIPDDMYESLEFNDDIPPGSDISVRTKKGSVYNGKLSHVNPDSIVMKVSGTGGNPHIGDMVTPESHVVVIKKDFISSMRMHANEESKNSHGHTKKQQAAIAIAKKGVAEGQENFNGIDISMEIQKDDEYVDDEDYDNQVLYVTASSKGKELGHVLFVIDGEYLAPQDLEVDERYRGQGIAQTMYDYVKSKGYKIRRSGQQTDAGAGFWDKHKPGKNIWEQGVAEGLTEAPQEGAMREIIRKALPSWPDYVIKDWISSRIKNQEDLKNLTGWLGELNKMVEPNSWKLHQKMFLTFDMLSPKTRYFMKIKRNFGEKNPFLIPRDEERSANAEQLVKTKGMENLPPVIMLHHANGLELCEGWHRTMAAFRLHPDGFYINVWIGQAGKNQGVAEEQHSESCPHCGGELVSEELMNEKKDACYYKVKSRYKIWPSAYASGALVKCRKKGAKNWGTKSESVEELAEDLHKWFKEKWVRFGPDGKVKGPCARGSESEGKPKCLPQSKANAVGKKARASAAARKRREDPNPDRSGKAKNVATKEGVSKNNLPPPENARKTQIAGTAGTYKKAANILNKSGVKGKTLDFGAGLGHGTKELGKGAHSYEPYPNENFKPNYVDVTTITDGKYNKIVNLNVLNVVPNIGKFKVRDEIVKNIGRVLAPGGIALITTRGKDVLTIKGDDGAEPMSKISKIGTYQKGFTPTELCEYVQNTLGDGFEVSKIKLGPAGVMIKKADGKKMNESLADDFLAMAKAKGYNVKPRGSVEQQKAEHAAMMAKRAQDRANAPPPPIPSGEEIASAKEKLELLKSQFDPNYQYSDDHSVWSKNNDLAKRIAELERFIARGNVDESIFDFIGNKSKPKIAAKQSDAYADTLEIARRQKSIQNPYYKVLLNKYNSGARLSEYERRELGMWIANQPGNFRVKQELEKYANGDIAEGKQFASKAECIKHFVDTGRTAAQGAAAWERMSSTLKKSKKPDPFSKDYVPRTMDNSRYGEKDLDEDEWHSQELGDAWHGSGDDPQDLFHSTTGGGSGVSVSESAKREERLMNLRLAEMKRAGYFD